MSAIHQRIHEEVDGLPIDLAGQVLDFMEFLKKRRLKADDTLAPAPPSPYLSWLAYRMDNPYTVESDWKPLSRDQAHDRQLR